MIVNLWNELVAQSGFTPSTTGTWTLALGVGPAAPATYNGNIDFTSTSPGVFLYQYTVESSVDEKCAHTANVAVNWSGTGLRANDECAGATLIQLTSTDTTLSFPDTFASNCPFFAAATESDDLPTLWGTNVDDLWYLVQWPSMAPDGGTVLIDVTGQPYGLDGVFSPLVASYSDCELEDAETFGPSNQVTSFQLQLPIDGTTGPTSTLVRVGRQQNSTAGFRFDLRIQTIQN